jgi:hypothetical protein
MLKQLEAKRVITLEAQTGTIRGLLKGYTMTGAFDSPKEVKPPPVPDPPPVPVVQDEAEEFALREETSKSGFKSQFLTGNLTPKDTGKKKFLA